MGALAGVRGGLMAELWAVPAFGMVSHRLTQTPHYLELKPIPLALVFQS